jgi:predicted metallopeptidase
MKRGKIVYEDALDVKERVLEIARKLNFGHIKPELIACIRSKNAKTNAIARCYALAKPFQIAFRLSPRYVIEVVAEKFDKLDEKEKTKVLLHELLHIPKSFGGGFRHHDYVNSKTVEKLYKKLIG